MQKSRVTLFLVTASVMGLALYLARDKQTGTPTAHAGASDKVVAEMIAAARNLLSGLSPDLRQQAALPFDHPARLSWHYYPTTPEPRKGAVLKKMTAREKALVKALLRAGTSKPGYDTALDVISLDSILRDIENTPWAKKFRDSDLYYVTIFGTPGTQGQWAWRIEGHHLSVNYVIKGGKIIGATPMAYGANPAEVRSGPSKGLRALAKEEDLARRLYTSLDRDARRQATVASQAPFDVFTEVKTQPRILPVEGIAQARMSAEQKKLLQELLWLYIGKHPPELAENVSRQIRDAGMGKVHFAWAGHAEPGEQHYYRIQGPTFVIEFCNSQNQANHIHAVWRSYLGDFGIPLRQR